MYKRPFTSGSRPVDKLFDYVISILNTMAKPSISSGAIQKVVPVTDDGGMYITGVNGMAYKLIKGTLVKVSTTSLGQFVITNENDYNVAGIVYEDTLPGADLKVVYSGNVYVYFNSNGSTMGDYFRMSRSEDTANTDDGKAHSQSSRPDALWLKGYVQETRIGEGLALCTILR